MARLRQAEPGAAGAARGAVANDLASASWVAGRGGAWSVCRGGGRQRVTAVHDRAQDAGGEDLFRFAAHDIAVEDDQIGALARLERAGPALGEGRLRRP